MRCSFHETGLKRPKGRLLCERLVPSGVHLRPFPNTHLRLLSARYMHWPYETMLTAYILGVIYAAWCTVCLLISLWYVLRGA